MKPSYSWFFRKCQDDETYDGCIARSYMKAFEETCQCLPFQLQFMKKVEILEFLYYIFNHIGLNMSSKKERVCQEYCNWWFRMSATLLRIVCHKLSRKLHLRSHWLHEQEAIFLWYEHKIKRQIKIIAYNSYVIVIDLELETNSDLKEIATKLSSEYWQYKGFYSFPDYLKGIYQ